MEPIKLKRTSQTPDITLDKEANEFRFEGKSIPEDAVHYYEPILKWIDEYSQSPNESSEVIFHMDYYNTASSKLILDILVKFNKLFEQGVDIKVRWEYMDDDEDMLEAGETYESFLGIPFDFVSYEEDDDDE